MTVQTFAEAFERVKQLVTIFSENEQRYLSQSYSEAQARLDFIDKFWIALGWDVNHETQTDPYKQEVYELYDLTPEEIAIVEGGAGN